MAGAIPQGSDVNFDPVLNDHSVRAFANLSEMGLVQDAVMPPVLVNKTTSKYWVWEPSSFRKRAPTVRDSEAPARMIQYRVASDSYTVRNYGLATFIKDEDVADQDDALNLQEDSVMFVNETLLMEREIEVADLVSSISNVGSGVALTAANNWANYISGDPVSDVMSGRAFMRMQTGLLPNTGVCDFDTFQHMQRNPAIRNAAGLERGLPTREQMAMALGLDSIEVGGAVFDQTQEGEAAASFANVWNSVFVLLHRTNARGLRNRNFAASFRLNQSVLGLQHQNGLATYRWRDNDPMIKKEFIGVDFYEDRKVQARNLAYTITGTSG